MPPTNVIRSRFHASEVKWKSQENAPQGKKQIGKPGRIVLAMRACRENVALIASEGCRP
jgi:malate synthase